MDEIKANPSTRRPLYIMIGQRVKIKFILLENNIAATTTGWTWRLCISRHPGDRKNIFCLTLGSGLRYEIYSDTVLFAEMTSAQTILMEEGEYYYKLERTDLEQTVLDGVVYATFETK